jgi:hypothetical protein
MRRIFGGVLLVLGAGIGVLGVGLVITEEGNTPGPVMMGFGAMLLTAGWLVYKG